MQKDSRIRVYARPQFQAWKSSTFLCQYQVMTSGTVTGDRLERTAVFLETLLGYVGIYRPFKNLGGDTIFPAFYICEWVGP